MVRPRCQGEESFFRRVKLEYPRLKKKHDIRWMDIQRPLLLEPCVDYKLTKPCICVNSFFRGCINLVRPEVCGRELITHLRFVRMYSPFLNSNEFTTAHLQFVKSTTHFLARITINNFNQPFKIEFNRIYHILMGSKIFLSLNF